jgi:hypothetical protein
LKENEALKHLEHQSPCRSIKRPDIQLEKLKMSSGELNAREKALEQREIIRSNTV